MDPSKEISPEELLRLPEVIRNIILSKGFSYEQLNVKEDKYRIEDEVLIKAATQDIGFPVKNRQEALYVLTSKHYNANHAIQHGYTSVIKYLLMNDSIDKDKALFEACDHGRENIMRILLEAGANPNIGDDDNNCLDLCISKNNMNIIQLLLDYDVIVTDKNISRVILQGNVDLLRLLLKYSGKPIRDIDREFLIVTSNPYDDTSEMIKFLISLGADIHVNGDAALHLAAENGKIDIVKILLENKADIHESNDLALRSASNYGKIDVVKLLIDNGANVSAVDNEALINFALAGHTEGVKLLLDNGADASNVRALTYAANGGHIGVVKLLLYYGENQAPAEVLKRTYQNRFEDILKIIRRKGKIPRNQVEELPIEYIKKIPRSKIL